MDSSVNSTNFSIGLPFALYDAFTEVPYSGSQAAVIFQASLISQENRMRIAQEIGAPATSFVNSVIENRVEVQFFSTVMELPMCGHGTVCLITRLVEFGLLKCESDSIHEAILVLSTGEAKVEYCRNIDGRIEVMLDINVPKFKPANLDFTELGKILDIKPLDLSTGLRPEIASADFVHLCLPMRDLKAMKVLQPNFPLLSKFCMKNGIETVATFCLEVTESSRDIHVRDFCPAVGVFESAAAGTTNAALAVYLFYNSIVGRNVARNIIINSEQGIELGRPSKVTTAIAFSDRKIKRLQVGGIASLVIEGSINGMITTFDGPKC